MKRGLLAVLALALLWGEYVHWRASTRLVHDTSGPREAVVVLGCRNRGTRANALNRWRVRAGLRSRDPRAWESCVVFCGGAVGSATSEASMMAAYAAGRGAVGPVVLEERSRTTRQNVENLVPLVEGYDRIKIVSNPVHAEKARRYLVELRPDLARRLVRGADYRFGEWSPLKVVAALYALRARTGARTA